MALHITKLKPSAASLLTCSELQRPAPLQVVRMASHARKYNPCSYSSLSEWYQMFRSTTFRNSLARQDVLTCSQVQPPPAPQACQYGVTCSKSQPPEAPLSSQKVLSCSSFQPTVPLCCQGGLNIPNTTSFYFKGCANSWLVVCNTTDLK